MTKYMEIPKLKKKNTQNATNNNKRADDTYLLLQGPEPVVK